MDKSINKFSLLTLFIGNNGRGILLGLIAGVMSNLLTILIPVSFGRYYELVFDLNAVRAQFLNYIPFFDQVNHPVTYLKVLGVLILLKFFFHYTERFFIARLGEQFIFQIRNTLFTRQLQLHLDLYDEKGIGRYLLRFSGDLASIRNYLTKGILRFGVDFVLLAFTLATLFVIHPGVGAIVFCSWLLICVLVFFLNGPLYRASLRKRDNTSGLLSFVNRRLKNIQSIKAFNRFQPESNKFKRRAAKVLDYSLEYHRVYQFIFALIPVLLYTMIGGILYYVYYLKSIQHSSVNQGSLVGIILLLITVLPVFRRLLRVPISWELGNLSFQKLTAVLHSPMEPDGTSDISKKAYPIKVQKLTYSYPNKQSPIFNNLNLLLKENQVNVVHLGVGKGKTTLIRLLLGIYQPGSGQIYYGANAISDVKMISLRRCITVVSASFPLLGRKVFEAVSYSTKKEKRAAVSKLLLQLQEHMPEEECLQLDAKIGEFGSHLSSSQNKLLLYVRALLTKKPIIIIEEPLKDLHPLVAPLIIDRLEKYKGTVVLITSDKQLTQKISDLNSLKLRSSLN